MKHLHILACLIDVAQSGSVRRTAERLNLTPSALTRRIQDFEQELGTSLFDRTPQGMRLNPAGELLVQHARRETAELDRVRSQIADLTNLRRGHIALVCSQAFTGAVVPEEIGAFRARHPDVSFSVQVRDYAQAAAALTTYEAELGLILQPTPLPELQVLFTCEQPVCAVMGAGHPLAGSGSVRLQDCVQFPIALPDRSLAVRQQVDAALTRTGLEAAAAIESNSIEFLRNYVLQEHAVSFQISMGIPVGRADLVVRELDRRDVVPMQVALVRSRGRKLSVAAAGFVEQVARRARASPAAARL